MNKPLIKMVIRIYYTLLMKYN